MKPTPPQKVNNAYHTFVIKDGVKKRVITSEGKLNYALSFVRKGKARVGEDRGMISIWFIEYDYGFHFPNSYKKYFSIF